jgi:N-methylhydantoinase A/oxoprolinase/acetone carboxylase beta subunit
MNDRGPSDNGYPARFFGLGIDAGGTFTDAVVVDIKGAAILAQAKAPTTARNPIEGIRDALRAIPEKALRKTNFVSLATTFATNAIVQGKGARAGLILIGYDRDHPILSRMSPVLFLEGGHNYWGEEVAPLELDPLEKELHSLVHEVDAIAVSGYFSVRNPEHENRVARYIEEHCDLPVVSGHQLSVRLDAPKRATTAWWNARLIPLINLLIEDTRKVLEEFKIDVPLLVVRGDGTLMSVREAQRRPIETILSGPAAGIMGAQYLTGRKDGLVVDMGGTTTDMAILKHGRVEIDPEGAQVREWKTQVEAARIRTTGLGGDSIVRTEDGTLSGLCVGPQRVEPLCTMAERLPEIMRVLKKLQHLNMRIPFLLYNPCTFYLARRSAFSHSEAVPAVLAGGPANEYELLSNPSHAINKWELKRLENQGIITRISLTPTDFCVARGTYGLGSREAAQAGVSILAKGIGAEEAVLYQALEKEIARRLCVEAVNLSLDRDAPLLLSLMHHWFPNESSRGDEKNTMGLMVRLISPVVGIGAPARAWLPRSFEHLHTTSILPEHFMVGTAVGAAVGTVGFRLTAEIRPTPKGMHILFAPEGKTEFENFEDAVRAGRKALEALATARMRANEVRNPLLNFSMERRSVPIPGGELYLCTVLTVQTAGRTAVNDAHR